MIATPVEQSRRWLSPLTHRWHRSSRLVMWLTLSVLIFCNVPGQSVLRLHYATGVPFYEQLQYEHGWPLTYLVRTIEDKTLRVSAIVIPEVTFRGCFALRRNWDTFRLGPLLANGGMVLLASFAYARVSAEGMKYLHQMKQPR